MSLRMLQPRLMLRRGEFKGIISPRFPQFSKVLLRTVEQPRSFRVEWLNQTVEIILAKKAAPRLAHQSFLGVDQNYAWNFSEWESWYAMERSGFIFQRLQPLIQAWIATKPSQTRAAFQIDAYKEIGWSTSVPLERLDRHIQSSLELFKPNNYCEAWRVTDPTCYAPMTSWVTFCCEKVRMAEGAWRCIIHHLYPGPSLGMLEKGNISIKFGIALFSPGHIGVPR